MSEELFIQERSVIFKLHDTKIKAASCVNLRYPMSFISVRSQEVGIRRTLKNVKFGLSGDNIRLFSRFSYNV